jgi:hypothetical protein
MSKLEKNVLETNEVETNEVETPKEIALGKVDNKELFSKVKELPSEEMKEENGDYLSLKEDTTYHFICEGLDDIEMNTENGKAIVSVAKLIDENNKVGIHGAAVLVSAMKRRKGNFPCMLRIVTRKFKNLGAGKKYLEMSIYTL